MDVIETFLLKQLDGALEIKSNSSLTKCFNLHEDCRQLKDLIDKKMPKDGAPVDPKIKENLYYLNNVIAEWHTLLEKHHHPTPEAMHWVNNLRGRLKQIREDLQAAIKEKVDSVEGGKQSDSGIYRWSSRSVDVAKVYGVEDKAMIMERLLVKEGFEAIGIVGMTGVGKTALCQKVFNSERVKEHFFPRIWVCLSKQPKVDNYEKDLVKRILMCLGFEDEIIDEVGQGGLSRLLFALRQQLKRHRYLIVLDDVWNKEEGFMSFCSSLTQDDDTNQERLGNGLPKRRGGKVIVTGRYPIMVKSMVGEKNLHSLLPLADEESCWKIFRDAVEKDGTALKEDMQKRKNEIVEKCAGLPLMAKLLGQIEHDKAPVQKKVQETQQET